MIITFTYNIRETNGVFIFCFCFQCQKLLGKSHKNCQEMSYFRQIFCIKTLSLHFRPLNYFLHCDISFIITKHHLLHNYRLL